MAASVAVAAQSAMSVLPKVSSQAGAVFCNHNNGQLNVTRVNGLGAAPFRIQQLNSGFSPLRGKRDSRVQCRPMKISCAAAGSASNQPAGSDESPYQVLGVSPFEKFDSIKAVYTRRHRDAERKGDEATMARLEGAYDQLLMAQLRNRKEGRTSGDFKVSKEIKYADKRARFPWGPKSAVSSRNDTLINFAFSAAILHQCLYHAHGLDCSASLPATAGWMYYAQVADWKPLQFLLFGYAWRIFMKLADFEPSPSSFSEEDEDQNAKRRNRNGKRLLRTLTFVFGSVAIASLAFTGILNGYELLGLYIPRAVINSQELFVTITSSVLLFFAGSYFR